MHGPMNVEKGTFYISCVAGDIYLLRFNERCCQQLN